MFPDHLVRYVPKTLDMVALQFKVMEGMVNFVHLETLLFMMIHHAADALNSHFLSLFQKYLLIV